MPDQESVLIIEDRRDSVRFLIRNVLSDYQVMVARDGQEGLRMAVEHDPSLVIADLSVPKMSGFEVLEALRRSGHDIPVILTTFHGTEEAAVRAYQLGAQAYLIQPYTIEQMRAAVERSLATRRLQARHDALQARVARLERQVERSLREQYVLAGVGRSIATSLGDAGSENSGLEESRLWARIVDAAVYLARAEEGFVFLVDEPSRELVMRAARRQGDKQAQGLLQIVEDELTSQVLLTGAASIVAATQEREAIQVGGGHPVSAQLVVPVKRSGRAVGVLYVDHRSKKRVFGKRDLELLSVLADYAALALDGARSRANAPDAASAQMTTRGAHSTGGARSDQLRGVLDRLDAYREQVRSYVQSARSVLTDLQQQALSIEGRLEALALPEARLSAALQGDTEEVPSSGWSRELGLILESISDGVLIVDETDRIVLANRAVVAMLGHSAVGLQIDGVCDDPRWLKTYHLVKTAAQLSDEHIEHDSASASTALLVAQRILHASFRAKRAGAASGSGQGSLGTVIVMRDVTAEHEAQRARDAFISSVSDKLRTPLTTIVCYADLIRSGAPGSLDESQTWGLNRIHANAKRVENLFDEMTRWMAGDGRQTQALAVRMDLTATIFEASGTMRAQMADKDQLIELELDPNLPHIQADPDALYHVLIHLLENAHRCSPPGARAVLRAVKVLFAGSEYVALSVSDQGGGIRPDDYRRVFNRYHRLDNPVVPGLGDPGVHLPIVRAIVEANGGRVWLDSRPGDGTTFTLILPAQHESLSAFDDEVGSLASR